MRVTRLIPVRTAGLLAMCSLLGTVGVSCASPPAGVAGQGQGAGEAVPTMPLGPTHTEEFATSTELIRHSYVVARGRFVDGPTVVRPSPEGEEFPSQLVVWEFVPDEVYRDVRTDDAPARRADERRGSFLVADSVTDVGAARGELPVADFLNISTSTDSLNSFPVDRPVYVFLRPGRMPGDAVERDGELAHVMTMTEEGHCYPVDDLDRSCAYVADSPGGEPVAALADGALVPRGLSREAIAGAGSVTEVVEYEPFAATDPVDDQRFTAFPYGGGEG